MNKKTTIYFKNRLLKELENLKRGENCNFEGLNDSEERMPDLIDSASSIIERSLSQSICNRQSLKVRKIEQALEDLAIGEYGICRRCDEDIAVKRLKANPVARDCICCKTALETREGLTADTGGISPVPE